MNVVCDYNIKEHRVKNMWELSLMK